MARKKIDPDVVVDALVIAAGVKNDSELAHAIGRKPTGVADYRRGNGIGELALSWLFEKVAQHRTRTAVSVICEFFPVRKVLSAQEAKWEVLDRRSDRKSKVLYDNLCQASGLYMFFNSSGEVIYIGKTKNELWGEIKNAFNRTMDHHSVYRTHYPDRDEVVDFAHRRKIKRHSVGLHETTAYLSAYRVNDELIDLLEGFLIRVTPNNVTNVRIENQSSKYW